MIFFIILSQPVHIKTIKLVQNRNIATGNKAVKIAFSRFECQPDEDKEHTEQNILRKDKVRKFSSKNIFGNTPFIDHFKKKELV